MTVTTATAIESHHGKRTAILHILFMFVAFTLCTSSNYEYTGDVRILSDFNRNTNYRIHGTIPVWRIAKLNYPNHRHLLPANRYPGIRVVGNDVFIRYTRGFSYEQFLFFNSNTTYRLQYEDVAKNCLGNIVVPFHQYRPDINYTIVSSNVGCTFVIPGPELHVSCDESQNDDLYAVIYMTDKPLTFISDDESVYTIHYKCSTSDSSVTMQVFRNLYADDGIFLWGLHVKEDVSSPVALVTEAGGVLKPIHSPDDLVVYVANIDVWTTAPNDRSSYQAVAYVPETFEIKMSLLWCKSNRTDRYLYSQEQSNGLRVERMGDFIRLYNMSMKLYYEMHTYLSTNVCYFSNNRYTPYSIQGINVDDIRTITVDDDSNSDSSSTSEVHVPGDSTHNMNTEDFSINFNLF